MFVCVSMVVAMGVPVLFDNLWVWSRGFGRQKVSVCCGSYIGLHVVPQVCVSVCAFVRECGILEAVFVCVCGWVLVDLHVICVLIGILL